MKKFQHYKSILSLMCISGILIFSECNNSEKTALSRDVAAEKMMTEKTHFLPSVGNLVEVKTTGMNFIMPDEIPSGWTTFRYTNVSPMTHFMLIDKMPIVGGKQLAYEDFGVIPPIFTDAMNLINQGKSEEGFAELNRLPAWMFDVIFSGGVGLVSPGETAQTTVYVKPGTYVVECYVKTGGVFHPMSRELIVTESSSFEEAPTPTLKMEISAEGGIEMIDEPKAGLHTIAVYFKDQGPHEHFMGHDVHLVKLEKDSNLEDLGSWMSWADPDGLNTPAPVKFIGGAQEMPAGNTAYFTVSLEQGRYAWISEVPSPGSKNMLKVFTIPATKVVAREGK